MADNGAWYSPITEKISGEFSDIDWGGMVESGLEKAGDYVTVKAKAEIAEKYAELNADIAKAQTDAEIAKIKAKQEYDTAQAKIRVAERRKKAVSSGANNFLAFLANAVAGMDPTQREKWLAMFREYSKYVPGLTEQQKATNQKKFAGMVNLSVVQRLQLMSNILASAKNAGVGGAMKIALPAAGLAALFLLRK